MPAKEIGFHKCPSSPTLKCTFNWYSMEESSTELLFLCAVSVSCWGMLIVLLLAVTCVGENKHSAEAGFGGINKKIHKVTAGELWKGPFQRSHGCYSCPLPIPAALLPCSGWQLDNASNTIQLQTSHASSLGSAEDLTLKPTLQAFSVANVTVTTKANTPLELFLVQSWAVLPCFGLSFLFPSV